MLQVPCRLPDTGWGVSSSARASPVTGNIMMGGAFSWTFIIQAILIGMLFISKLLSVGFLNGSRIKGSERYTGYIKFLVLIIFMVFRRLALRRITISLSGEERAMI